MLVSLEPPLFALINLLRNCRRSRVHHSQSTGVAACLIAIVLTEPRDAHRRSWQELTSDHLSEVEIYNRCAPSCIFAGANATHLALAPFDGDLDFAMRCGFLEPRLSVGIGVYA